MDGTIKPVGMPNAKEDCPPMDQFKGVLDEIGNNFDCMLKTANWIDENGTPDDEKIAEFFNSLEEQEAIKVDNCIKDAKKASMEGGRAWFEVCDVSMLTEDDIKVMAMDNEAAIRLYCLNDSLLRNECIPATKEIKRIQEVLNPHHE